MSAKRGEAMTVPAGPMPDSDPSSVKSTIDRIYDGVENFVDAAGAVLGVSTSNDIKPAAAKIVQIPAPSRTLTVAKPVLALPAVSSPVIEAAQSVAVAIKVPRFEVKPTNGAGQQRAWLVTNGTKSTLCKDPAFAVEVAAIANAHLEATEAAAVKRRDELAVATVAAMTGKTS